MELRTINLENLGLKRGQKHFAEGYDSFVYEIERGLFKPRLALHIYKKHIKQERLIAYYNLQLRVNAKYDKTEFEGFVLNIPAPLSIGISESEIEENNNKLIATKIFVEGKSIFEEDYKVSGINRAGLGQRPRLKRLSQKLSKEFDNRGIDIAEGNAKVRGNRLTITDLCFELSKLEIK